MFADANRAAWTHVTGLATDDTIVAMRAMTDDDVRRTVAALIGVLSRVGNILDLPGNLAPMITPNGIAGHLEHGHDNQQSSRAGGRQSREHRRKAFHLGERN